MRENKILVCFALILTFIAGISAQEKTMQDEVSIENLLKLEDFTTLRFLVSTREDVKTLVGEEYIISSCVYKGGWKISYEFAGDILHFYLSNPTKNGRSWSDSTFIKPEYKGTLVEVSLFHRSYVFPENYSLPPNFDCYEVNGITYCNNGETVVQYWSERDSPRKNIVVRHRVSINQYKQITGETELQRTPPQQKTFRLKNQDSRFSQKRLIAAVK